MELTYYLRIVGRRWIFALIGLLLTTALTIFFVEQQPSVYRSTGTMVVRPRTVNTNDGVRAIDTLTRGVEISSTYATIARSDLIRDRAQAQLDPSVDTSDAAVSSEVVTSTSILEVSVTGGDPAVVNALAAEVTAQTVAYVAELQNVFELQVVDEPALPTKPIAPNRPLLIGTGVIFGLAVGVVFALLAEAVSQPARARRRYARARLRTGDRYASLFEDEAPAPTRSATRNDSGVTPLPDSSTLRRRSRRSSA